MGSVQSWLFCHTSHLDISVAPYATLIQALEEDCCALLSPHSGPVLEVDPWVYSSSQNGEQECAAWLPPVSVLLSQIHTWDVFPAQHDKSASTQQRGIELC